MDYIDKTKYPFDHDFTEDFVAGEDDYEYYTYKLGEFTLIECETGEQVYCMGTKMLTYNEALNYLKAYSD